MASEDIRKREQENMRRLAAAFDAFWLSSGREREPNEEDRLTFLGAWAVQQLEIGSLKADLARVEAELALWKPMTPEEAQKAYDAAEAAPLSEEAIERIWKRVTDPAERMNNSEEAQLVAALRRKTRDCDEAREAARWFFKENYTPCSHRYSDLAIRWPWLKE